MSLVTVSPKFQVVIPKELREELGVKVGDRLEAVRVDGKIQLKRVPLLTELRGSVKGPNNFVRDKKDREF
jgi:AbrB family looped-hinge helix DNA binding protein